jgi:hypothetical protein
MRHEGDFRVGLLWATLLSIPLYLSIWGWIQLVSDVFHNKL